MFAWLFWLVAVCSSMVRLHKAQWPDVKRRKRFYVVTCCVDLLGQPSLQALRAETMVERFTARMHVQENLYVFIDCSGFQRSFGIWLVETVLLFRPSNILLGQGRRSSQGDEQKIREKHHVVIDCSGS